MSQYTDADYRREFAELERKEQENQKLYNDWFMNTKMAIQTYNNIVKENQLEDKFELIEDSDELIHNLDKEAVKQIHTKIKAFKDEVANQIEVALGLKQDDSASQQSTTTKEDLIAMTSEPEVFIPIEQEPAFNFGGFGDIADPFAE